MMYQHMSKNVYHIRIMAAFVNANMRGWGISQTWIWFSPTFVRSRDGPTLGQLHNQLHRRDPNLNMFKQKNMCFDFRIPSGEL